MDFKVFVNCILATMVTLNVFSWNMRGIMYGTPLLSKYLEKADVGVITEHWLKQENANYIEMLTSDFKVSYTIQSSDSVRGAGGIAMFVRKEQSRTITEPPSVCDFIVAVKIS